MGSQTKNGQPARYNATLPTITDGEGAALEVDSRGRLILSPSGGGGLVYNATPPTLADTGGTSLQGDANGNLKATLATALDEDIDAITVYNEAYAYAGPFTASGIISAVPISYGGYLITASSSGVISIYDNASAASGNALVLSKSVSAGDIVTLNIPVKAVNGLYFSLVSGTATILPLTRKTTAQ